MTLNLIILSVLLLTSLWTAMSRSLLRGGIGLALTSAVLSIIMFRLNSPLAAVFELSVCAGLISVIFITTISLTQPLTMSEVNQRMRQRLIRFWPLPLLVILAGAILVMVKFNIAIPLPVAEIEPDVRLVLWNFRQIDLIGQILVLLAGAFGVVILFKERIKK
jgi:NADH-quinone oxidoreductase subunit J